MSAGPGHGIKPRIDAGQLPLVRGTCDDCGRTHTRYNSVLLVFITGKGTPDERRLCPACLRQRYDFDHPPSTSAKGAR